MNVTLPRMCLGKEIIAAWRKMTQVKPGDKRKYAISQSPKQYVQDNGPSTRRTGQTRFKSVDLCIRMYVRKKKFVFFGEETWAPENGLMLNISDLELESGYHALETAIIFESKKGQLICFNERSSPAPVKKQVETAVQEFITALIKTALIKTT